MGMGIIANFISPSKLIPYRGNIRPFACAKPIYQYCLSEFVETQDLKRMRVGEPHACRCKRKGRKRRSDKGCHTHNGD